MHFLAVSMLEQHRFCVYKEKGKVKLLIPCENFCSPIIYFSFALLIFLENLGERFAVTRL